MWAGLICPLLFIACHSGSSYDIADGDDSEKMEEFSETDMEFDGDLDDELDDIDDIEIDFEIVEVDNIDALSELDKDSIDTVGDGETIEIEQEVEEGELTEPALCKPCGENNECPSGTWCMGTANGKICYAACGSVCDNDNLCPKKSECVYPEWSQKGVGVCDNIAGDCLKALTPPKVEEEVIHPTELPVLQNSSSSGVVCTTNSDCPENEICDNSRGILEHDLDSETAMYIQPTFTCRKVCFDGESLDNLHYAHWSGNPNGAYSTNIVDHWHACRSNNCSKAKCVSSEKCSAVYTASAFSDQNLEYSVSQWMLSICLPKEPDQILWTCPLDNGPLTPMPERRHDWELVANGCVSAPKILSINHGGNPQITELDDKRLLISGIATFGLFRAFSIATIYDPDTNNYTPIKMRKPRFEFSQTKMLNGEVFISGGVFGIGEESWKDLRHTEIFDPVTDKFRDGPVLVMPRTRHVAIPWQEGVLIIGGANSDPHECSFLAYRMWPFIEYVTSEKSISVSVYFPYVSWDIPEMAPVNDSWILFGGNIDDGYNPFQPDFNYKLKMNKDGNPDLAKIENSGLLRTRGDWTLTSNGELFWFGGFTSPNDNWMMYFPSVYSNTEGWEIISSPTPTGVYGNELASLPQNKMMFTPNMKTYTDDSSGSTEFWKERGFFIYDITEGNYYQNRISPARLCNESGLSKLHTMSDGTIVLLSAENKDLPSYIQLYCPMDADCYNNRVINSGNVSWE